MSGVSLRLERALVDALLPLLLDRLLDEIPSLRSNSAERPLTLTEAADFLRIGKSTLSEWAAAGKVPHLRAGARLLFLPTELLAAFRVYPEDQGLGVTR